MNAFQGGVDILGKENGRLRNVQIENPSGSSAVSGRAGMRKEGLKEVWAQFAGSLKCQTEVDFV